MKKQQRMLLNQLHALDQMPIVAPSVRQAYEQTLQTVDQQIKNLEQQLKQSEEENDEEFELAIQYATSVKGIGRQTARIMLLVTNCFKDFDAADRVSKFFGLTPASHFSGSSVRVKGRITKMGPSFVRSLLFNCTRSAIRFNPACKELFQRLRKNGKPYKVAAVAVMHKLVKQVFACVKKQEFFDPEVALNLKKN